MIYFLRYLNETEFNTQIEPLTINYANSLITYEANSRTWIKRKAANKTNQSILCHASIKNEIHICIM